MKKIKNILYFSIICILISVLLFVSFSKFILKKDIIKIGGYGALIVVTGSMEPTIHIKELIIIKEQKHYAIGDIVTYRENDRNLVTHRIVNLSEGKFVPRGDNNTLNDVEQDFKTIEGKVVYHSIVLGEFFFYWLKPIIIIIISICAINLIIDFIKNKEKKTNEN